MDKLTLTIVSVFAVCAMLLLYLAIAFVLLEPNPSEWLREARGIFAFAVGFIIYRAVDTAVEFWGE